MRKFVLLLLSLVAGVAMGYAASLFFRPAATYPVEVNSTRGPSMTEPSLVRPRLSVPASAPNSTQAASSFVNAPAVPNPVFREPLRVRGYVMRGKHVNVVLSDGTILTERDKELEGIERNSVTILGKKYAIASSSVNSRPSAEGIQPPRQSIAASAATENEPAEPAEPAAAVSGVYVTGPDGVSRIRPSATSAPAAVAETQQGTASSSRRIPNRVTR